MKKKFPPFAADLVMFESIQDVVYSVDFTPLPKARPEELREALDCGETILDTCKASLDARAFVKALVKLFTLLKSHNPEEFSGTLRSSLPERLMTDYLLARGESLEEHASRQGITTTILVSCCQQAARPQLVSLREANAEADLGLWSQGYCPVCGALPAMAQIESRGTRTLYCPNCFARYRFARHYCPGCGHAGLKVIQMEAWPGLLIEACPDCDTYLKTWSRGAGEPPCPFPYLDIVTRDVDEAAGLQNLKRLSLSAMGV